MFIYVYTQDKHTIKLLHLHIELRSSSFGDRLVHTGDYSRRKRRQIVVVSDDHSRRFRRLVANVDGDIVAGRNGDSVEEVNLVHTRSRRLRL